ncbi:hypothetical protein [Halorhabdus amylolytica]|uniref:hypothetical protein n=1 Tax=Halorhabdus amylolytica TaxID=2559573 RepID=UPI00145BD248|nr:hypothetical protein [Halorhabdus amylolytica]
MRQSRSTSDPVAQPPAASLTPVLTVAASLTAVLVAFLLVASYPPLLGVVVPLI